MCTHRSLEEGEGKKPLRSETAAFAKALGWEQASTFAKNQAQCSKGQGEGLGRRRETAGPETLAPTGPRAGAGFASAFGARLGAIERHGCSKTKASELSHCLGGLKSSSLASTTPYSEAPSRPSALLPSPSPLSALSGLPELTNMPRLVMLAPGPLPCGRPALPTIPLTRILTP